MQNRTFHPLPAFFNTLRLFLSSRVHFPRQRLGQEISLDGERWVIFRQVIVDPPPGAARAPGAVFRPRFHIANMSVQANQLFSWLPMLFILGLPGFRSKLWLVNPLTGDFSGYYEWESVEQAERYAQSFAMRFMTGRSLPGSVYYQIIPQV